MSGNSEFVSHVGSFERLTAELPTGKAVIAIPVGAIVTDNGRAFAVEPLDMAALPIRVRCISCLWQATANGLAAGSAAAQRHTEAHLQNPAPAARAIGDPR